MLGSRRLTSGIYWPAAREDSADRLFQQYKSIARGALFVLMAFFVLIDSARISAKSRTCSCADSCAQRDAGVETGLMNLLSENRQVREREREMMNIDIEADRVIAPLRKKNDGGHN